MNVLLSSIAKNDIRLLMRVFNAEKKNKGIDFLEDLKVSIGEILHHNKNHETKYKEVTVNTMQNFPVNIHYIFEDNENLLVTAIFKV
ncbi:hypothetical protein JI747_017260 [Chryseobacterium sp. RG1]|uniref:ParE toxin of type II toxin-antitoxin system, parDE n=1 Tax=Chryseobacterium tagetis TaxID=2801334 RepID=A0ABS8A4K5_9FLAO|nr:hypothetical protein [Chryseobacterium tagetis]MCA6068917.1 hypothetical protein [Chryseobacterium tagetis]